MPKFDDYLKSEAWKDYYVIECYQYIGDEQEREVAIAAVEASKTADEAKAVIARAKG
jgi:hypothetical protein